MARSKTVPCPVGPCIRNHRPEVLTCRPCWSMIRGGDGGALAAEVYEAVAAYHDASWSPVEPVRRQQMREVQARAIAKAEARWLELHGGSDG